MSPRVFRGVGVSPGVAVGRALPWEPGLPQEPVKTRSRMSGLADELARFASARARTRDELHALRARLAASLGESYAAILEAQTLLVDDPVLVGEIERRLREESVSAAWAIHATIGGYLARFETIEDGYLRDRGSDLRDFERRLLRLLGPEAPESPPPEGPLVVVAHALGPSDTVALAKDGVVGLAADLGGPTSHTAILAHAFGLPAVVGLGDFASEVAPGASVVVDGDRGEVLVDPEPAVLEAARARGAAWASLEVQWERQRDLPSVSRDGVEVVLRANVEFPDEAGAAVRYGARGIGLYRSEFLFVAAAPRMPDEEEHYRAYRELADKVAPHPAIIRTLDLGGEKYFHDVLGDAESNPVLGARGLRLCLMRPEIFVPQLRALLRAAAQADVRILLPLVTSANEIAQVRKILAREGEALRAAGVAARPGVPLGAMVETPAAAMTADLLLREADFLSIGTNDLIQYTLAVDRSHPAVASLYEPFHPAILRMIRFVIRSGRALGVPVSLCGEMASSPELVPTLLGLGLRELSCPPRFVPAVRDAIRATDVAAMAREVEERCAVPDRAGAGKDGLR
jgi:phosphotransferase system enzyme I (PtsI)